MSFPRFSFLIALFLLISNTSGAQRTEGAERRQSGIMAFPELFERNFYRSQKKLKAIDRLTAEGKEQKAYDRIKAYVRRFAIRNFQYDGPVLADFVRLSGKYGPEGEALLIARLLVRHQSKGLDSLQIKKIYDSLEHNAPTRFLSPREYLLLVASVDEPGAKQPGLAVNLGDAVNSSAEDYAPTFGNTDNLLLFTSKRNRHQTDLTAPPDEDLFISRRKNGEWQKALELRMVNTIHNEGSACLSPDGKTLFFSRCDAAGSFGNCDLYMATLSRDSVWQSIVNLGRNVNSGGWESHPALTRSGDTLFFASNRIGGFGLSDIYFSVRGRDGKWGKATNAGPMINTHNSEVSPFVHHRQSVLYFSSNGQPVNFGDFDIYRTAVPRNAKYREPENCGPLINSGGHEYYFTMDGQSGEILFARSASLMDARTDIYTRPLPMEAQPGANTVLNGKITDEQGMPFRGVIRAEDINGRIEIAPRYLGNDGLFRFPVLSNGAYRLWAISPDGKVYRRDIAAGSADEWIEWVIKP